MTPRSPLLVPATACAALGLALTLTACQEDAGGFRGISSTIDVDPGGVRPIDEDARRCEGGPLDFGAIEVGDSATAVATVINVGELPFNFISAELTSNTDSGEFRFEDISEEQRVEAGGELQLRASYVPTEFGDDVGVITITTDDKKCATLELQLTGAGKAGEIEVCLSAGAGGAERCNTPGEALPLEFGTLGIGFMGLQVGKIKNPGDIPLRYTVLGFDLREEVTTDLPLGEEQVLMPGREKEFVFTFMPLGARPQAGRFEIVTNDPDANPVVLSVTGQGDGAAICAEPLSLDFGDIPIGRSVENKFRISSCGTQPLDFDRAELVDDSSAEELRILGTVQPFPEMLPGDSFDIDLAYAPTDPGIDQAKIILTSNDSGGARTELLITGRGGTPETCFLTVSQTRLDFGAIASEVTTTRPVVLANGGSQEACVITELRGPTPAPGTEEGEFSVPDVQLPLEIPPGGIVEMRIQYAPLDAGIDEASLILVSNDTIATEVEILMQGEGGVPPVCELRIDPRGATLADGYMNFGQVGVGEAKTQQIRLENRGTAPCDVSDVRYWCDDSVAAPECDPAPFTASAISRTPLGPGEEATIDVTFTPNRLGSIGIAVADFQSVGHAVVIDTSDDDHMSPANRIPGVEPGTYVVGVGGTAAAGKVEVVPGSVDFGVVTRGCRSPENCVKIYNTGAASIVVDELRLEAQDGAMAYELTRAPVLPATIEAGLNIEVCMAYRPTQDSGAQNGQLTVVAQAENTNMVTVELFGEATLSAHQTDVFRQLDKPKVDVLFVIDNSGSMSEEQENVANNFTRFISAANASNVEYQIGVISTEVNDAGGATRDGIAPGVLFGGDTGTKIIDRNTADGEEIFRDNVAVGQCCSDEQEAGLQAARLALSDPPPPENEGFLRSDAKLAIIFVSDEQDQSDAPIDFYIDFFKAIKGFRNTALFNASAIVGDAPTGCSGMAGGAQNGSRYIEVAEATGGLFRSICTTNWGRELADLGVLTFGVQVEFLLSRPARPATMRVSVNGRPQMEGFTYDGQTNSIIYRDDAVPPRGAIIEVDYDVACLQ